MTEPKNEMSAEEQAAARKKAKAKIRTIRIWAWVILALLAATALLSQCAMSKPQAKQNSKLATDYCTCMWDKPLDKLSEDQIRSLGKLSPQEQLDLLGGAQAFEERDKQCVAGLKAE